MNKSVIAKANQSLLDIVLTTYGTLEAAMETAFKNGIPLSYVPEPGSEYLLPEVDAKETDQSNVSYLDERGIVLGTLHQPVLGCEVVLMPRMHVVPNIAANPHTIGYYSFDLVEDAGFVNAYELVDNYLSDNELCYETEERWLGGSPFETAVELTATPMSAKSIPCKLPWSVGLGYLLVWSDPGRSVVTATFRDVEGNEAYSAPLTILDNLSQDIQEHLIGEIALEILSATPASVRLRLTRSHPPIGLLNFRDYEMEWLGVASDGEPDTDDPENSDKTIILLGAGVHTLGLKTTYYYPLSTPPSPYPSSAFTMTIKVA